MIEQPKGGRVHGHVISSFSQKVYEIETYSYNETLGLMG